MKSKKILFVLLLLSLLPLAVVTIGCHPYYNTFYNANEAYQIAQRHHAKAMRASPDSIVVSPPPIAEANYKRAIDKSLKMMEVFPDEQKRRDRAHFLMGRSSFYKTDFNAAIGNMRDLQAMHPESPLVPRSLVYVAKSHIMLDNLQMAEDILLVLLRDHPELNKKNEITMLLVEIAIRRDSRSQALGLLGGINLSSLPLDQRIGVILRMAEQHYELRQFKEALNLLQNAPRTRKHPHLMYRVDRSIYFCLDAMDSLDATLSHLMVMQRNRRYTEQRYEIMYYRALTLRRMGRIQEAIALLEEIRQMCGKVAQRDTFSLCGQAIYKLAMIYQDLGDFDKAQAMFEEASKIALPPEMRAGSRLWALKRLKELRVPDSLGNIPAEARYSIAELFRFELEIPDSAYIYYMELAEDTTAVPDSLRPRALLSAAVVMRHQMGDKELGNSLLRAVITEYPGSEYARWAQVEKEVKITVVTRREMAERAFRAAEVLLATNPVEAVKAFYEVYMQYPDKAIAPRSLHAAAWHTDNVLQRNRAAMTLYEELCENYPESRYCQESARYRLNIARDTIEARRQRREEAARADSSIVDSADGVDDIDDNDITDSTDNIDNAADNNAATDTIGDADTVEKADTVDTDTDTDTVDDAVDKDSGSGDDDKD